MAKNKQIDFLAGRKKDLKAQSKQLRMIKRTAFGILAVYLLVGLGIFGFHLYVKRRSNQISSRVKKAKARIKNNRSVETKQRYLVSKVKSLSPILASKEKHRLLIESLLALLPEGVSVGSFEIGGQESINFSVSSKSFPKIEEFLGRIKKNEELLPMKITEATVENFSFTEKNKYSLGVKLSFKELQTQGKGKKTSED